MRLLRVTDYTPPGVSFRLFELDGRAYLAKGRAKIMLGPGHLAELRELLRLTRAYLDGDVLPGDKGVQPGMLGVEGRTFRGPHAMLDLCVSVARGLDYVQVEGPRRPGDYRTTTVNVPVVELESLNAAVAAMCGGLVPEILA